MEIVPDLWVMLSPSREGDFDGALKMAQNKKILKSQWT